MQSEPSRPDVIRPLARVAARTCARPGCPSPASTTLSFRYEAREAVLRDLSDDRQPGSYDLCAAHADRTGPPHGWDLDDRRTDPGPGVVGPLGGDRTVALIARALGRDPRAPVATDPAEQAPLFEDDGSSSEGAGASTGPHEGPGADGQVRASTW